VEKRRWSFAYHCDHGKVNDDDDDYDDGWRRIWNLSKGTLAIEEILIRTTNKDNC
jgi:hypothetical protein